MAALASEAVENMSLLIRFPFQSNTRALAMQLLTQVFVEILMDPDAPQAK